MANWRTNGFDLHLVAPVGDPDRTFPLADYFVPDNAAQTWTFTPVFTPFTRTVHGVELATNGQLTFFQGTAAVRNFIVNAVHGTDPPVPIRIHRHDLLDSVELTPTKLTLRQQSSARFSILAVFKDHVDGTDVPCVADISQQPGLTWAVNSGPVAMSNARPGFVVAGSGPGTGTAVIQVTLPAELFPVGATPLPPVVGNIQLAPDWSTPLPDSISWVAGPGFAQWDNVPNILILPDGFPNRAEFENAARAIINKVKTSPTAAPWNLFLSAQTPQAPTPQQSGWVNVWMAWVPSPKRAATSSPSSDPRKRRHLLCRLPSRPPAISSRSSTSSTASVCQRWRMARGRPFRPR